MEHDIGPPEPPEPEPLLFLPLGVELGEVGPLLLAGRAPERR